MNVLNFKKFILVFLCIGMALGAAAQDVLSLSVAEFQEDPLDLSAKDQRYEKFDGNGERFAIIKVTSTNPHDDLSEYTFNFGNLRHQTVVNQDAIWVYVQRNAKQVTIARSGYTPVRKYDLGTTIAPGKNYTMLLDPVARKVQSQVVQFNITPADALATIAVTSAKSGAAEEILGTTRESGTLAKSLPLGVYKYKIVSANYHTVEGKFTLSDRSQIHMENVTLSPNYGKIEFVAPADADIFINGERKGKGKWSGSLSAGTYNVECRQLNHRPSVESVTIRENESATITLQAPTPITNTVFVTSEPLNADIYIDGKFSGKTPQNIELLVGKHKLRVIKEGIGAYHQEFDLSEHYAPELDIDLKKSTNGAQVSGKTVTISVDPEYGRLQIDGAVVPLTTDTDKAYCIYDNVQNGKYYTLTAYVPSSYDIPYMRRYAKFKKRLRLDDISEYKIRLPYYERKTCFYLGMGGSAGASSSPKCVNGHDVSNPDLECAFTFTMGGDIGGFNIEGVVRAGDMEIVAQNCSPASYTDSGYYHGSDELCYAELQLACGYSFIPCSRLKLTPQIGIVSHKYETSYVDDENRLYKSDTSLYLGLRAHLALSKHWGVSNTLYCSRGIYDSLSLVLTF